jgi:actin-like ATPase involved in cell morphogenesis
VTRDELAAVAAAASAGVGAPVSLHLLRPHELKAGMITQTAVAPQLAAVFCELFTHQAGHELYLREPAAVYGLPLGTGLAWKDVAEAVRRRGDTAVGFTRESPVAANATGLQLGHGSDVFLGVPAECDITLQPADRLVVIALE